MAIYLLLLTAICVTVLTRIAQLLYRRFQFAAIVDKIPGPRAYPLIGNALDELSTSREDRFEKLRLKCDEYNKGGIFRSWLGIEPIIHLITAETAGVIFTSKNLISKSTFYEFLHPWLGKGLLTTTGDAWHRKRKLITPTFHFKILEEFVGVMSDKAEILKKCITSELKKNPNNLIDIFDLLSRCALDIICESAMGINVNAQTDHGMEYTVALESIAMETTARMFRPWLHSDWIYYRTSQGKKYKHSVETAHKFANQVISERKLARKVQKPNLEEDIYADKPKRQAFLDHLLDACDRDNIALTDDELRDEVETFMFAGHETGADATGWALFCIGNNPDVQEKIHQEQLQVFGDSTNPPTFHQLVELKYLERVIKETLRLFPSAPSMSRRVTEDVEIAGYKIPKNATAAIHVFQIHRDPKHWSEPEKFDPDRFLPENFCGRHPYAYVPFSAGLRNCIGQKFALLEIKTILTAVLRTWRIRSLHKYHEAKCYNEFSLKPQDGIKIYLTRK